MDQLNTIETFERVFSETPELISWAPGRLEILGNHTDYNEGYVLSAAVNYGTEIAIKKTNQRNCHVFSSIMGAEIRSFDLDEISSIEFKSDWLIYIIGIVKECLLRSYDLSGFKVVINSNMPISAGMSSSASLEMSLLNAILGVFKIEVNNLEKAKIGQACENKLVGAQTGLLDQISSLNGKEGHFVFSEYRNLKIDYIPVPNDVSILVVNSGVQHDLSYEYNDRRRQCESAFETLRKSYPSIRSLRDINLDQLIQQEKELKPEAYRRAKHVIEENKRVLEAINLLKQNELKQFGDLCYESHLSSKLNFENSCLELDDHIEMAKSFPKCLGARLSGGGFGGISIHLLKSHDVNEYLNYLEQAFLKEGKTMHKTYLCAISRGAHIKKLEIA